MKRGSFQKSVEKSTNQAAVTSFNDRGLVRKLTVAGIIVSLFSVVAFALLFVQDHRENEADAWLARTRTTIDSLGKLSAAARQQYEWISTAVKLKSDRSSFQAQLEASDQNFNRVF